MVVVPVVFLSYFHKEFILFLPKGLKDSLEQAVIIERLKFFGDGLFSAGFQRHFIDTLEDGIKLCVLSIRDEAESQRSKEAVSVSSDLPIRVDVLIHLFLKFFFYSWTELIQLLPSKHGDRNGIDRIFYFL
jgi:hypothetical protein